MCRDRQDSPLQIVLIRHGRAPSNDARRYLGRSDEPLSPAGVEQAAGLARRGLPMPDLVFTSPLRRCRQTALIVFPDREPVVVPQFVELDFGRFEGRTHDELTAQEPAYQAWLDSRGAGAIPSGETQAGLLARCREGFAAMIEQSRGAQTIAAVVHSGVIMALLAQFAHPARAFYDCFIAPCGVVLCEWDGSALRVKGGDLK